MACNLPLSPSSDNQLWGAELIRLSQAQWSKNWEIPFTYDNVIVIATYKFRNDFFKDSIVERIKICLKEYQEGGSIVLNDYENKQNVNVTKAVTKFFSRDIFQKVPLAYWEFKDLLKNAS